MTGGDRLLNYAPRTLYLYYVVMDGRAFSPGRRNAWRHVGDIINHADGGVMAFASSLIGRSRYFVALRCEDNYIAPIFNEENDTGDR